MDIKSYDVDDVLDIILSGRLTDALRDVIISILQVDMGNELNPNSAGNSMAGLDEALLLDAMKHLTEEEKSRILSVMKRAEYVDREASQRTKQIKEEFYELNQKMLEKQAIVHNDSVCPVCEVTNIQEACHYDQGGGPNACSDCEQVVCACCGVYELHPKTKFQTWVCIVCSKRRSFVIASEIQSIQEKGKKLERSQSLQCSDDMNMPRPMLCRQDSLPDLTVVPQKAQRPNFLHIPDDEYFKQQPNFSNTNLRQKSPDKNRKSGDQLSYDSQFGHWREDVDHRGLPSNPYSKSSLHADDLRYDPIVPYSNAEDRKRSRGDPSSWRDTEYSSPSHNACVDYSRAESSCKSYSGSDGYYMSEEEELALIAHHSKHDVIKHEDDFSDAANCAQSDYFELSVPPDTSHAVKAYAGFMHNEWSPTSDLSPIQDVSPTLELEAEAEWLAEQRSSENEFTDDTVNRNFPKPAKRIIEQISDEMTDKERDSSQSSTVESGYESQSMGNVSSSAATAAKTSSPSDVRPRKRSGHFTEFENATYDSLEAGHAKDSNQYETNQYEQLLDCEEKDVESDDVDFVDDVPVIAEGTIFNIHGGRDMFAKRSPLKQSSSSKVESRSSPSKRESCMGSPVKAPAPRQLIINPRILNMSEKSETKETQLTTMRPRELSVASGTTSHTKGDNSVYSAASGDLVALAECTQHSKPAHGDIYHVGVTRSGDHRLGLCGNMDLPKPVPAPRRKVDNSLRTKSTAISNLESDDEIVEIRFDEETSPIITRHGANAGHNRAKKTDDRRCRPSSCDRSDVTADIQRSMDHLQQRENDENEITKDLERQLAEIRRLEERQRNILQNTLRQVVNSVQESHKMRAPHHDDDLLTLNAVDYSSLLSPSFNRKVPVSSPALAQRSIQLPQSPRKTSVPSPRNMQTISENGGYNVSDLASMSPATSHRALSNIASPLPSHKIYEPRSSTALMGSQSLPTRGDRLMQQTYQDYIQSGSYGDLSTDKNFRLSSSYTELLPNRDINDRSGYFSDRETDRRKGLDNFCGHSTEAARSLLQFEIEKRQKQVEENNRLRGELHKLIQAGAIPAVQYERLREMYREHINRSREFLLLSNSSLNSTATSFTPRGADEHGYNTDSDNYMSSTEHLSGAVSQSSTVDRLMQSNEKHNAQKILPNVSFAMPSPSQKERSFKSGSLSPMKGEGLPTSSVVAPITPAMPLLEIKAPRLPSSRPSSAEFRISGDITRAGSEASFGDPEERIVDAKLEGGVTILKSKDRSAARVAMPATAFNFPTKQILIIPDSTSRERGLGLEVRGEMHTGDDDVSGAFVTNILPGTVAAQLLGELKPGDEIVEWNGVCLRNKSNFQVQDIISRWNGEIELTVRLDRQPFHLPKHHRKLEHEVHHHSQESVLGFESPLSDKSWSKEFDDSRSVSRRRAPPAQSPVCDDRIDSEPFTEPSAPNRLPASVDSFTRITHKERPRIDQEHVDKHVDELNRQLTNMSKQLEHMERQPLSPAQDEPRFMGDKRFLSRQRSHSSHDANTKMSDAVEQSSSPAIRSLSSDGGVRSGSHREQSPVERGSPMAALNVGPKKGFIEHVSNTEDFPSAPGSNSQQSVVDSSWAQLARQDSPSHQLDRQQNVHNRLATSSPRTARLTNTPRLKDCGEIEAILMYNPNRHVLVVRVERAMDLRLAGKDILNPFIKLHFMLGDQILEKRCTRYIENNCNPKWEQAFTFSVDESEVCKHKIKMSAWHYFQPKQNIFIGTAVIDLATHQYVDGKARLHKLGNEPSDPRRGDQAGDGPHISRTARQATERTEDREKWRQTRRSRSSSETTNESPVTEAKLLPAQHQSNTSPLHRDSPQRITNVSNGQVFRSSELHNNNNIKTGQAMRSQNPIQQRRP